MRRESTFAAICRFLGKSEYKFITRDEDEMIGLTMTAMGRRVFCTFVAKNTGIEIYVISPLEAPEAVRRDVVDLLNRINWRLRVGNFELDMSDGMIQYRIGVFMGDVSLTARMFHDLFDNAILIAIAYWPVIEGVLSGRITPSEAESRIDAVDPVRDVLGDLIGSELDEIREELRRVGL